MRRLLVLAPGEISRDPRARRAALAATARGYEVVAVCRTAGEEPRPLPGVDVVRLPAERVAAMLRARGLGGTRRSRPVVRELRGVARLLRLGAATVALVRAARPLGPFDVVHANDFDTLPAAWLIARRYGARLVYDAHELYTRQEPDPPRLHGFVALAAERVLARRADAVTTVGESIARELDRLLRLRRPALAVLSCPERYDGELPARSRSGPLRAVYQGAMGPGRPLDDLFTAAEAAGPDVELTIRVLGPSVEELTAEAGRRGLAGRVVAVEPVPPDALVPALLEFDVGLVINRPVTLNDEHVSPNKLFEYLMAGLAVVVPRLPGMAPLAEEEGIGLTFAPGMPEALGEALRRLAEDRDELARMQERARRAALEQFNAEAQAERLARVWGG